MSRKLTELPVTSSLAPSDLLYAAVVDEDSESRAITVEDLAAILGSGGLWSPVYDDSEPPLLVGIVPAAPVSLDDLDLFLRQPGDPNHSIVFGFPLYGVDGPAVRGYGGGALVAGDSEEGDEEVIATWSEGDNLQARDPVEPDDGLRPVIVGDGVLRVFTITQAAYDALDPPDETTLYVIVEEG